MKKTTRSRKGELNWRDIGHSLLLAVGTAVCTSGVTILQTATDKLTLESFRPAAVAGAMACLIWMGKQLQTNSGGKFGGVEQDKPQ